MHRSAPRRPRHPLLGAAMGLALCASAPMQATFAADSNASFWSYWSDGKAEMAGYDLVQPRYGQLRHGRAVLIFVTEPFSRSRRVKVDHHDPKDPDHFVAFKLNFVRRFQTGVYDYGLMTSLFVDPDRSFAPVKLTFSAQEWCGHVYQELLFDPASVTTRIFSYFEGESREDRLEVPPGAGSEDNLFITLRQLGSAMLDTSKQTLPLLGGVTQSRLRHMPLAFYDTEIVWDAEATDVTVPAGTFSARKASWKRQDGQRCKASIEAAYPHRIIAWSCEDGEEAKLTGSERLDYWRTHEEGDEQLLRKLGLGPMRMAP